MVWKWVGGIILWLMALFFLRMGVKLNKETHKKKSFTDYAPSLGISDSIPGFVFELIFSLIIGLIMKGLPWWMAKGVLILIGVGLVVLGYKCIV